MDKFTKIIIAIPFVCGPVLAADSSSGTGLRMKTSKVPTFAMTQKKVIKGKTETVKVKNIPLLNIGEEKVVKASGLSPLTLPSPKTLTLSEIKKHVSPPLLNVNAQASIIPVGNAKIFTTAEAFDKIPNVKPLSPIKEPATQEPVVQAVKVDDMQPNDYKLLQALIFLEIQKNYELAMGLFAELIDDPRHHIEALYNYAMTAKGLGLPSEFRQYMLKVSQESKNKEWQQRATEALVSNIDILENSDVAAIEPLVQKFDMDVSQKDNYQLARAKYYSEKGQLGLMEDALILIPETSKRYPDALLLTALFNYRQGKVDEALVQLEKLLDVTSSDKTSQLRAVGAMTLGRMQFQKSLYKEAFQSYLKVDKSNPLWLQAMVESAWTQILSEDYEGAAGNMFSLHTDFFKNAFSPESYVVRTVGYLNLCQYGDGMHVLSDMNKRYSPWKNKLEEYKKSHKDSMSYYDTIKNWAKNADLKEVDGLPRSFIVELARHPSFTNVQKQINNFEDETNRFNNISMTLLKMERDLIAKQNEASKQLAGSKKSKSAESKLLSAQIQHHIAKKARISIKNLRTQSFARIEKEKAALRVVASKALQIRFGEMLASLDKVLDQNEVLSYELYSGAGEHIRYQMAGGDINDKERPELKVEKEKSLNWKFKGEVWEDEVGHYRSSLKNVCPQDNSVAGNN
ncbi:MAG: tetratricopeptide repeat protein [Bdellovibrio sp.]